MTAKADFTTEYAGATEGAEVSWGHVAPADLTIDPRVQRPKDDKKIRNIIREFEPKALGQITLSKRTGGTLVILDGQHRYWAAQAVNYRDELEAKIFAGLTLEQEARLFRLLNNTTKASRLSLFLVAVTEGDETALEISRIVEKHGMRVGFGSFSGVATAEAIVRRNGGAAAFDWALDVITRAYGAQRESYDSRLVSGLALLRLRDGFQLSTDRMVSKLAKRAGGVAGVIGYAKTIQSINNAKLGSAMGQALVSIYNKQAKLEENKLGEWGV